MATKFGRRSCNLTRIGTMMKDIVAIGIRKRNDVVIAHRVNVNKI